VAVYELNGGQLLRVARSIDGKLQQQYFSLIGLNQTQQLAVRKEAKGVDEKWAALQGKAKEKRVRTADTPRKHTTGIRGINLVHRPSPAFRVQVQAGGKSMVREFSVKRMGADAAWGDALKFLSDCRGYPRVPAEWKDRMPKITRKGAAKKTDSKA